MVKIKDCKYANDCRDFGILCKTCTNNKKVKHSFYKLDKVK